MDTSYVPLLATSKRYATNGSSDFPVIKYSISPVSPFRTFHPEKHSSGISDICRTVSSPHSASTTPVTADASTGESCDATSGTEPASDSQIITGSTAGRRRRGNGQRFLVGIESDSSVYRLIAKEWHPVEVCPISSEIEKPTRPLADQLPDIGYMRFGYRRFFLSRFAFLFAQSSMTRRQVW